MSAVKSVTLYCEAISLYQVAYQHLLTKERQNPFILSNKIPYEKRCLFSSRL